MAAAILPGILKFIGIALLWILIVLVILIACLLFTPFVYRGRIRKNDDDGMSLRATLSWLFRLIYVKAEYAASPGTKAEPSVGIYVFGIPVLRVLAWLKKRKKAKGGLSSKQKRALRRKKTGASAARREPYTGAKKKPTVTPHAERKEEYPEVKAEVFRRKQPNILIRIGAYISSFFAKLRKIFSKIREIFSRIGEILRFLRSEQFTAGVRVIKREGVLLLKHIRPRKISGRVAFGFEDPSLTGKLLGVLGVLYPVIPQKLALEPDFENKRLEADVKIRGHFFGIVLLVRILKILLNKDVKALIGRFRKKKAHLGKRAVRNTLEKRAGGSGREDRARKAG